MTAALQSVLMLSNTGSPALVGLYSLPAKVVQEI